MEAKITFEEFAEQPEYNGLPAQQVLVLWRSKVQNRIPTFDSIIDVKPFNEIMLTIRDDKLPRFIELVKMQKAENVFMPLFIECEIAKYGRIHFIEWCFANQAEYLLPWEKAPDHQTVIKNYDTFTWDVMLNGRYWFLPWFAAIKAKQYKFLRHLASHIFSGFLLTHPQSRGIKFNSYESQQSSDINPLEILDHNMLLFLLGMLQIKERKPAYNIFPDSYTPYGKDSNGYRSQIISDTKKSTHPMHLLISSQFGNIFNYRPDQTKLMQTNKTNELEYYVLGQQIHKLNVDTLTVFIELVDNLKPYYSILNQDLHSANDNRLSKLTEVERHAELEKYSDIPTDDDTCASSVISTAEQGIRKNAK